MTSVGFNGIIIRQYRTPKLYSIAIKSQDGDAMKTIRSFAGLLLSVILIITSAAFPTSAQTDSVETMANLVVFVKFPEDTATDIADNSQKIVMTYNDTTNLYTGVSIDFSFKKYISTISRGKLNVYNVFPQLDSDTIVPYTLSASHDNSDDTTVLQEVIAAFNSGKIKLPSDKLDNRYSQSIDNTTIIIQGRSTSGSDFLWPHKSVSPVTTMINNKYYIGNYNIIDSYTLTGAVSSSQGVVSHEFLHSVGLPDLYRLNGASGDPVGTWDIMASNSFFQQYPLSYQRYKMGWIPMKQITQSGTYTLDPVSDPDSDTILYEIKTPMSGTESFMLEYRKKKTDAFSNLGFETKIPSSGLLIYRVNKSVPNQTNAQGQDYLYVFRPGETSATASEGDLFKAALDPSDSRTGYGSSDFSAGVTDGTIFYSDGSNSGLVISDVAYNEDSSQISFHVEFPDYSSLGLWDVIANDIALDATGISADSDGEGNIYACIMGRENWNFVYKVYKYDGSSWTALGDSFSGINSMVMKVCDGVPYVLYSNKSGNPQIAKYNGKSWSTVYTDTSVTYPNDIQLFAGDSGFYAAWTVDGAKLVIKKITSSGVSDVDSSLTTDYFANPSLGAVGDYIYVTYCNFAFGSGTQYTQIKRYSLTSGQWENITVPNPLATSNLHRSIGYNGEYWMISAASGKIPIIVKVDGDSNVTQYEVPTTITNFLGATMDISDNGTVCVSLISSGEDSQILYLDGGEWKQLGSNPCSNSQSADMTVSSNRVFVASVLSNTGGISLSYKDLPERELPELVSTELNKVFVSDGYITGLPQKTVNLNLYLEATNDGYFKYDSVSTGGQVLLYTEDDVLVKRYTIVIKGDVNGDGIADGTDAVVINAAAAGMLSLDECFKKAADTDGDGSIMEKDNEYPINCGLNL